MDVPLSADVRTSKMQQSIPICLVVFTVLIIFRCHGQEQVRMTMISINHFKSEVNSHYQCRMSHPDYDPIEITVESLRTGFTRNTETENPDPPNAYYTTTGRQYYKVDMYNNGNNDAFGVFGCNATKNGKRETIISTTRMRSDADIVPMNGLFTQTVSIGDSDVTINMTITTNEFLVNELRWRNNTNLWDGSMPGINPNFGADTFTFDEPIQLYHAGIYECHSQGDRASAEHGLNLLIVRACPSTRWGPPACEGVCDSCYNGGICDEITGHCVCAPGFTGKNCSTACGGNRFGYDCEQRCSFQGDSKSRCGGYLFCLVHPFGCRCNTGFRGLDCNIECDPNTFGASCLQSCHCSSDQCNRYTGECEGTDRPTSCDPGFTGPRCQECVNGYFGLACDRECHCSSDTCNRESGLCQTGGCLPQWADLFPPYSCQTGLVSASSIRVNAVVPVPVNCTAVIGPGADLSAVDFVLSRSPDDLDDVNITSSGTYSTGNTDTRSFLIDGVDQNLTLYCQIRTNVRVAVFTVTINVFVLPEMSTSPTLVSSSSTTITIRWAAWDQTRDTGSPPVVSYNLYHKLSNDSDWKEAIPYVSVDGQDEYYATVTNLSSDTLYDFSVAAVREGYGGEGPKSPPLELLRTTMCKTPPSPENVVANILGEKQQLVEISWKFPSEDIGCSSGVTKYTVHYYSSETTKTSQDVTDPTATSLVLSNLTAGVSYTIFVTLSTSGGESDGSNEVNHLVPVLPSSANPPSLALVTCNSVSIMWGRWTEFRDPGTPPIVHYIPYLRESESSNWITGEVITHNEIDDGYQFTFHDLTADSMYEFCVVVVREEDGGEGDKTNIVKQRTAYCSASSVPAYVIAITVVIPGVVLLVAAIICFKRYRGGQSDTHVAKGPTAVNYENAGFGSPDDYASIEQDHVKRRGSGYQDVNLKQQYESVVGESTAFSEYEIPINSTSSRSRGPIEKVTGGEENPYEIPVCK